MSHGFQLELIKTVLEHDDTHNVLDQDSIKQNKSNMSAMLLSHIKTKLSGYKQQDILKKRLNELYFVKLDQVVELLSNCDMKCHYCSQETYVLYERVREMKQWSLDRIDNNIGHNSGNLVVACLDCNLKRRRTNKDAFLFTKNMVIIRDNHEYDQNNEYEN